ncbi:hypothetical protein JOL79_11485 [Microbispora sp. RL4-1S]|uniref:Uncharacterized protein n=1 Tax=Microbispora oryzae TaxID=2806554 RepID=A0A940WNU8_9ACTN|nr:hypothetical protein [Microbispora oryzae]MBP2704436.1 hypothetical protein [Microbispora oryzae]
MPERRDDLPPLERAVSDTLDDHLARNHGILTSSAHPRDFLEALAEHGYQVIELPPRPIYEGSATLTDERDTPLDVHVQVLVNPREDTGDCTVFAAVQHHGAAFWLGSQCALRLPDGRETTLTKAMSSGRVVQLHGPQPALATTEETP